MKIHFIAGLPRSGSTLLSAILRQNPRITAGISSPLAFIFNQLQESMGKQNEAFSFVTPEIRTRVLRGVFTSYYDSGDVVFDSNRRWPVKISALVELFPDCRMICCVRPPAEVVNSVERQLRKHPNMVPTFFGGRMGHSVYDRADMLCRPNGMIGNAMTALREAFYGPYSERILFVEYEALTQNPAAAMKTIYEWVGEPLFQHDFANIQPIPGVDKFDEDLQSPGLHFVKGPIRADAKPFDIPPDVIEGCPEPFWR